MGNSQEESKKQKKQSDLSTLYAQYGKPYELLKKDQTYFIQLLTENQTFAKNLFTLFPNVHQDFELFFEMIMYLRKDDPKINSNKTMIENASKATLLDRFFMIVLGIEHFAQYATKIVNNQQLDALLIEYMKLFIAQPEKGTINKILTFLKIEDEAISLKVFSSTLRQHFPNVNKFLKDYYHLKFNKLESNGHLLKAFNSKILNNDAVLLALRLPRLCTSQIVELYNTEVYGIGFHSIEKRLVGYTGPWLMLVEHVEKNQKNQKVSFIFGAYQNGPIRNVLTHQGDLTGFLFTIDPEIRFLTTNNSQGGNHYFYINSVAFEISKRRKGFGFGGNGDKQTFKLWIDEDLDKSTINNGKDVTYGYGRLAGTATEKLNIKRMEVWGLGSAHNVEEQAQYWKERQQEINKRRKVDKREFADGNAQLFFGRYVIMVENTFGHRDQVIGEIQKNPKKEEENK